MDSYSAGIIKDGMVSIADAIRYFADAVIRAAKEAK